LQHLFAEFLPKGEIQLGRQFSRKIHPRQKSGGQESTSDAGGESMDETPREG
jgi:hypothetical protein